MFPHCIFLWNKRAPVAKAELEVQQRAKEVEELLHFPHQRNSFTTGAALSLLLSLSLSLSLSLCRGWVVSMKYGRGDRGEKKSCLQRVKEATNARGE